MAFKQQYRKLKLLGRGAFGVVYLTQQRDNPEVQCATKEIQLSHITDKERDAALAEATLLKKVAHPYVVGYVNCFLEEKKLYIIMEYADGGDLASKILQRREDERVFRESNIMTIFAQIALALQHIHSHNIIHRDLKPMNVFLTKRGLVKLGDFGIARMLESSVDAHTLIGTPFYLSPEVCNTEPYGSPSDIWSLGVVTYELAALKVPFRSTSVALVAIAICNNQPEPLPKVFTKHLLGLVEALLQKVPSARPKLEDLLQTPFLQHYLRCLPGGSSDSNSVSESWSDAVVSNAEVPSQIDAAPPRSGADRSGSDGIAKSPRQAPSRSELPEMKPDSNKHSDGAPVYADQFRRKGTRVDVPRHDANPRRDDVRSVEEASRLDDAQRRDVADVQCDAIRRDRGDAQRRQASKKNATPKERVVDRRHRVDYPTNAGPDEGIGRISNDQVRRDQEAERLRELEIARCQGSEHRRLALESVLARMAEDEGSGNAPADGVAFVPPLRLKLERQRMLARPAADGECGPLAILPDGQCAHNDVDVNLIPPMPPAGGTPDGMGNFEFKANTKLTTV